MNTRLLQCLRLWFSMWVVALCGCKDPVDITKSRNDMAVELLQAPARGALPAAGYVCGDLAPQFVNQWLMPTNKTFYVVTQTPGHDPVTLKVGGTDVKSAQALARFCLPLEAGDGLGVLVLRDTDPGDVPKYVEQLGGVVADVVGEVEPKLKPYAGLVKIVTKGATTLKVDEGAFVVITGTDVYCAHHPICAASFGDSSPTDFVIGARDAKLTLKKGRLLDSKGKPAQGAVFEVTWSSLPSEEVLAACNDHLCIPRLTRDDGVRLKHLLAELDKAKDTTIDPKARLEAVNSAKEEACVRLARSGACATATATVSMLAALVAGDEKLERLTSEKICDAVVNSKQMQAEQQRQVAINGGPELKRQSERLAAAITDARRQCFAERVAELTRGLDVPSAWAELVIGRERQPKLLLPSACSNARAEVEAFQRAVQAAGTGLLDDPEISATVRAINSDEQVKRAEKSCQTTEAIELELNARAREEFRQLASEVEKCPASSDREALLTALRSPKFVPIFVYGSGGQLSVDPNAENLRRLTIAELRERARSFIKERMPSAVVAQPSSEMTQGGGAPGAQH